MTVGVVETCGFSMSGLEGVVQIKVVWSNMFFFVLAMPQHILSMMMKMRQSPPVFQRCALG